MRWNDQGLKVQSSMISTELEYTFKILNRPTDIRINCSFSCKPVCQLSWTQILHWWDVQGNYKGDDKVYSNAQLSFMAAFSTICRSISYIAFTKLLPSVSLVVFNTLNLWYMACLSVYCRYVSTFSEWSGLSIKICKLWGIIYNIAVGCKGICCLLYSSVLVTMTIWT